MNVAIIAAGGKGLRFGSSRAKQFLEIGGIPILLHTLRRFDECTEVDEVVVVLPARETPVFLEQAEKHLLQRKLSRVVVGGATRTESVWKGLKAVRAATAEIVVVHDGVRPLVTIKEISRTIYATRRWGAAILVAPISDTIKEVNNNRVVRTLDRSVFRRALTPQAFKYELLRRAYDYALNASLTIDEVTDDSSLVEKLGIRVATLEGDPRNIKITHSGDLKFAEVLLRTLDTAQ